MASGENGDLARIASGFVSVWSAILGADALMAFAGIGILVGFRPFGYLLALVPLVSIGVGLLALRAFE